MSPAVAVIIATRNRPDKIRAAIESVLASELADIEVVVVDQSDDDATEQASQSYLADSRFRYIASDTRGLSRARNVGFSHTTAPLVAITDDDCLVPPDWVGKITEPFAADPAVGLVFGSVVPLEPGKPGATPSIAFERPQTMSKANEAWKLGRGGLCLGASMAVRRTTYDRLGGFDQHLGAGSTFSAAEDNDLSWRCLLSGGRTHVTNAVEVVHDGHRTLDEVRALVNRDFFGVGGALAKYVRTRHPGAIGFLLAWAFKFGVVGPGRDVLARQRPRGFRRPYMMARGLYAGMRAPLNAEHLLFEPIQVAPASASPDDAPAA